MSAPPVLPSLPGPAGSASNLMSFVIEILPIELRPSPLPACASCPVSDWYNTMKVLRCYCVPKRAMVWMRNEDAIMNCDAREKAVAMLIEENRRSELSLPLNLPSVLP